MKFPKNLSLSLEDHEKIDTMCDFYGESPGRPLAQNELVHRALVFYEEQVFMPEVRKDLADKILNGEVKE